MSGTQQYVGANAVYPGLPQQTSVQAILPAYVYQQFADDDNIQAFFMSQNGIAAQYLLWFNTLNLPIYTQDWITGYLVDWIGSGIYGIPRPSLTNVTTTFLAGYNTVPYDVSSYNGLAPELSATSQAVSDDIYKRFLTWNLYRGDGYNFSVQWLKNRVARFLNGANGTDVPVLNYQPSVTISGDTITITVADTPNSEALSGLISAGILPLPAQYDFVIAYS